MKHFIIFVGLDVHKDSIVIALADDGRNGEIRFYGTIGGDLDSLDKAIRKFRRSDVELRFVYDGGNSLACIGVPSACGTGRSDSMIA